MAKKSRAAITPLSVLKHLCDLSDTMKARSQSATGSIGQAIKDAADKKNLHPAAFKIVNRWREIGRDDPIKLRMLLDMVDAYRDMLKIDSMASRDMVREAQKAKKKPKKARGAKTKKTDNVVKLVHPSGEMTA
jgi:hypothetical protein